MTCNSAPRIRRLLGVNADQYQCLRLEGLRRHPEFFRVAVAEEEILPPETIAKDLSESHTLGAFLEDTLVGVGSLAPFAGLKLAHKGLLYGIYVRQEASGRGFGEAIVRGLISESAGVFDSVQLTVAANNVRARELYERCGFQHYATEPRSFRVKERFYDESLYRRPLT